MAIPVFALEALVAMLVALPQAPSRTVAFTFDDLPAVRFTTLADARAMTARLLDGLQREAVPAIGFVNEGKLDAVPAQRAGRIGLLAAWLDAGHTLGNHTYSHLRLYGAPLGEFEADVLRGEQVTRPLAERRGGVFKYFRHPTLNTGRSLAIKDSVDQFLAVRGYVVAPVTVDSDEYLYAAAYDQARGRGDSALMRRIGSDYLRYTETMFAHFEALSVALERREIAQVLLLHANWLNADWLDPLVAMLRRRGYRFVSLDAAMADAAYRQPDRYTGSRGPSWLERWAVTRGLPVRPPPEVPGWVSAMAR